MRIIRTYYSLNQISQLQPARFKLGLFQSEVDCAASLHFVTLIKASVLDFLNNNSAKQTNLYNCHQEKHSFIHTMNYISDKMLKKIYLTCKQH